MKKDIPLALALAASLSGPAQAQSTVTVFGLVDLMAAKFTGAPSGVSAADVATRRLDSGGMSTSTIGLRGAEDLGDGLSASFELSSFMRPDTGEVGRSNAIGAPVNVAADPFWSRSAWVGLSSRDVGRIRLGNGSTLLFVGTITSNAFGDSTVFSPINLVTFIGGPMSGGTGWTHQAIYDSPAFAGFTVTGAVSAAEGQGGRNAAARVTYAGGLPFGGSLTYQTVKKNPLTFADGTSANNTRTWLLAGWYDFNVAKLFGHLGRIRNDGTEAAPLDVNYKVWEISASVPVGAGNLLVGYASRTTDDAVGPVPATAAGGNRERKVCTLGYDYFLSKRTDVYAMIMNDRTTTDTLPAPPRLVSASATDFAVGLRHRF